MEDGGVEILPALGEDLFGGGAGVGRRGVVEGGHFGKKGFIICKRLGEGRFGAREEASVGPRENPAHHLHNHGNAEGEEGGW